MGPIDRRRNDHPAVARAVDSIVGVDGFGRRLLTALGCPPDLSYFVDGLSRTLAIIRAKPDLFVSMIKVQRVFGCELPALEDRISHVIRDSPEHLSILDAPERFLAQMERLSNQESHPFRNYCLGTCIFWSGLFYTLPNSEADGHDYTEFFSELAVHFLSLTSTVEPGAYQQFIAHWAEDGHTDSRFVPLRMSAFQNRLAEAGLAARRLTLTKHGKAFHALTASRTSDQLEDRLYTALDPGKQASWSREDWRILNELGLLFGRTIPGWCRPGHLNEGQRPTGKRGGGTRNRHLPDGFVRLSGTDYVQHTIQLDTGESIDLIQGAKELEADDDDPLEDQLEDDYLAIVESNSDSGQRGRGIRTIQSRRQAAHIARYHQQLTLALDVPTHPELRKLVGWLEQLATGGIQWPDTHPEIPLLIAASLATGRTIEEIRAAQFKPDDPSPVSPFTYLTGKHCWQLRIHGPTYATEAYAPAASEYPVDPTITLHDYGLFGQLLDRSGLSGNDAFHLQKLTGAFRAAVDKTLASASGDRHVSTTVLARIMFRLLLSTSHGDLV